MFRQPEKTNSPVTAIPEDDANIGGIIITYSAKNVGLLDALAEIARQAHIDIYLTDIGIMFCQMNKPPFPNEKSEKGEVWKIIYKSSAK